ncbi:hypothetical protein [Arsenicicoccus dermatophilus]|uniref:hypothetical protein n=1 Tax=Arsenicicoccus dermatophilus TaxID=1076331 RepID=UPI001F4D2E6C|nr:hypothetical protein [Arsenicicoccus dermatophilus]MCH8614240.1 hypothetical protein [Arsenicicoccus dermatophilus]
MTLAVTAALAGTAAPAAASTAVAAPAHRGHHATPAPLGFTVQRTLGIDAESLATPAAGDVWVAGRSRGQLVVQHVARGRVSTQRLGAVAADAVVRLTASSPQDVWVTDGKRLLHSRGRGFSQVALPEGIGGVTNLVDVPGPGCYVTAGAGRSTATVWRFTGAGWAEVATYGSYAAQGPAAVAFGATPMMPRGTEASRPTTEQLFVPVGGTAVDVAPTWQAPPTSSAWLFAGAAVVPESARSATVYGFSSYISSSTTRGDSRGVRHLADGAIAWPVTGAARLANGITVLGGSDTAALGTQQHGIPLFGAAQGRFALHRADGSVQVVAGDPGDRTVQVSVEKGTDVAWALTRTGTVSRLQRLDAHAARR